MQKDDNLEGDFAAIIQAMPSLADKLKALGVKVGAADLTPPAAAPRPKIAALLPGEFRPTPAGEVFVVEQVFSAAYRHGVMPLSFSLSPLVIEWLGDERLGNFQREDLVFLDTETSGLAGGSGTLAFLVGVGRFEGEDFRLAQFFLSDPAEEPALLEALAEFLAPAQAFVTFNGKAFDIPLLTTRFSLHRIPLPYKGFAHLDLLPLARRLWRDRLPSRALKYLEEHVLKAQRSSEEVPGYEIPWLYFDYLRSGDPRPLVGVFYHNAMDVVAMAALLAHVCDLLEHPFDGRVEHGLDFIALGKLFEDLGRWEQAARLYERGLETNLTESDFAVAVKRLSILQKRRGNLEEALRWWEEAAAAGHIYAMIELAKYHEHRQRDVARALHWAQMAQQQVNRLPLPPYLRRHWLGEIEHRLARLQRKAGV